MNNEQSSLKQDEKEKSCLKFDVKNWYYMRSRGMSVNKAELMKYIDFEPMLYGSKSNIPNLASFFCEIHYPFYLNGLPKTDENLFLRIYLRDYQKHIEIPASIVEEIWLSGWPRAGYMGELYTDFPWRLLKPIKEFLDNPTDVGTLINSLYPEYVDFRFITIKIYYDLIIPWIKDGKNDKLDDFSQTLWLDGLKRLYEMFIDMHKQLMFKKFSCKGSGYAYVGIVVDVKRYQNLSEDDQQNPFLTYMLDTCVPHQDKYKLTK